MVMSDDTDSEVLALELVPELVFELELVLELAERGLPSAPTPDRRAWIEACLRVRRLVLELRAGIRPGQQKDPDGPADPTDEEV